MPATEASGNGPDTAERAPLDARGWVPSVFRARPAHRNVSCSRLPLAFVFRSSPCRHRGIKGQKVKVGAKAGRRRVAAAEAAPKVKAVLSGFRAIFHAGNSHFRANRGGAARCEQPGVRGAARGGALRPSVSIR